MVEELRKLKVRLREWICTGVLIGGGTPWRTRLPCVEEGSGLIQSVTISGTENTSN